MSNGYGKSAPSPVTREQSIQLIVQACLDAGITNEKQIAYVLATAEHESQDFSALEENYGRSQAMDRGYEGGEDYFGRGYAHLTHDYNYRKMGDELGIANLEQQPQLAADPQHAANILAVGMLEGIYTGQSLGQYINERSADYVGARAVVNGSDQDVHIAGLARDWEAQVPDLVGRIQRDGVNVPATTIPPASADLRQGMADGNVFHMQQYLVALGATANDGRAITADGDFGPRSHQAVVRYQQDNGIEPADGVVSQDVLQQMRTQALQADPDFALKTYTAIHGPLNDNILSLGERGDPVIELKKQLEGLDHTVTLTGRSRNTYDQSLRNSVIDFQRDAGLPRSGIADERTRDAINAAAVARGLPETAEVIGRRAEREALEQRQNPPTTGLPPQHTEPLHVPHIQDINYRSMFPSVLRLVHDTEQERGICAGQHSQNLAGVLTLTCVREGVQPDRVELNHDGALARAVQHGANGDDPLFNRVTSSIATAEAVKVPEQLSAQRADNLAITAPTAQTLRGDMDQQPARAMP